LKATERLPGRSLRFVVIGLLLFIGYQLNILFADERLAPQSPQTQDTQAEQSKNQPGNRFGQLVTKNVSLKISPELAELFAGAPGDTQDLETMQSHLRRLVPRISRATVAIQLKDGMGSGVIISKDGYVLTAGHVVGRPDQQVTFILHDGRRLRGKTLGAHRGMHAGLMKDAGLMKIANQEDLPYAEMGQSRTLKQGQWCLALGHPGGYQAGRAPPLRLGRILLLNNEMLVSDCTLVGGDSGGPLFDAEGKVIGIHSRIGEAIQANLHKPVDAFREHWQRLVRGDLWGGPSFIGVFGVAEADRAQIDAIIPGSAAAEAGIIKGDIILSFNGAAISDFASLVAVVGKTDPGRQVAVELRRGNKTLTTNLMVGIYGY